MKSHRREFLAQSSASLLLATPATSRPGYYQPGNWFSASSAPSDCPFPASRHITGLQLTGRHREYGNADTWYPTWAANGNLYSPWTDGYLLASDEYTPYSDDYPGYPCNSLDYRGRKAATAQAEIVGDNPLNLHVVNLKPRVAASAFPYGGRYPCGSLVHEGVWYYGTYCLTNGPPCGSVGWTELGPFVGFRYSADYGRTWVETPHTPSNPLFKGILQRQVKIGSPHFVDLGKNMQHSPNGKAYLVAHGSTRKQSCNSWIQGDQIYLLRVSPSISRMQQPNDFEFFAGHTDKGQAVWMQNFGRIQPLLEWVNHLGCVTSTYNPHLDRYLICVTRGVSRGHHDTLLLEAKLITGPWSLVAYLSRFGPEAYFVNIPSKFISADGRTCWLCYSANWSDKNIDGDPYGSHYAMCLHEVVLRS